MTTIRLWFVSRYRDDATLAVFDDIELACAFKKEHDNPDELYYHCADVETNLGGNYE